MRATSIDVLIGQRLVALREAAGLSRDDCALLMEVPPNELVSWELGEVRMPASELYRFVRAVGCELHDVYAFSDEVRQSDQVLCGEAGDLGQGALTEGRLDGMSTATGGHEDGQVIPFRRKDPGRGSS